MGNKCEDCVIGFDIYQEIELEAEFRNESFFRRYAGLPEYEFRFCPECGNKIVLEKVSGSLGTLDNPIKLDKGSWTVKEVKMVLNKEAKND